MGETPFSSRRRSGCLSGRHERVAREYVQEDRQTGVECRVTVWLSETVLDEAQHERLRGWRRGLNGKRRFTMKRLVLGALAACLAAGTFITAQEVTPFKVGTFER